MDVQGIFITGPSLSGCGTLEIWSYLSPVTALWRVGPEPHLDRPLVEGYGLTNPKGMCVEKLTLPFVCHVIQVQR